MPGHWTWSTRLKSSDITLNASRVCSGATMNRWKSPALAPSACHRSPCSVFVGTPVDGPARCTSMNTAGISIMPAAPIASVMSAKPPPEVAHMARTPVWAAPMTMFATAISSSTWRTMMPRLRALLAIQWSTPVDGLMG